MKLANRIQCQESNQGPQYQSQQEKAHILRAPPLVLRSPLISSRDAGADEPALDRRQGIPLPGTAPHTGRCARRATAHVHLPLCSGLPTRRCTSTRVPAGSGGAAGAAALVGTPRRCSASSVAFGSQPYEQQQQKNRQNGQNDRAPPSEGERFFSLSLFCLFLFVISPLLLPFFNNFTWQAAFSCGADVRPHLLQAACCL